MTNWHWVDPQAILDYNDGEVGLGVRDENAVRSAMARPENLDAYKSPKPDAADLAASYVVGIAQNQGFVEGNKRSAWIAAMLFLGINGYALLFDPAQPSETAEVVDMITGLATRTVNESQIANWFRLRIV